MKMWIEDLESIKAKLSLIKNLPEIEGKPELSEKSLAGVASWQLGMEDERVWTIIKEAISE